MNYVCKICKKHFIPSHKKQIFCSRKCWGISERGENNPRYGCKISEKQRQAMNEGIRKSDKIKNKSIEQRINSRKAKLTNGKSVAKTYPKYCSRHQHRVLIEKSLGRTLERTEIVHHINCTTTDNRLENLFVFENLNQHMLHHRYFLDIELKSNVI